MRKTNRVIGTISCWYRSDGRVHPKSLPESSRLEGEFPDLTFRISPLLFSSRRSPCTTRQPYAIHSPIDSTSHGFHLEMAPKGA